MKRFRAFILIIIVAVAAFTPCCTIHDCQDEPTTTTQQNHRKMDDGNDCSPFYACTGCAGFTLIEKTVMVSIPTQYAPQYFVGNFGYPLSTYADAPWQPPRCA